MNGPINTGLYDQKLQTGINLRTLLNVEDINNITSVANGLLGKRNADGNDLDEKTLRERRVAYFYDKTLLDTIKLGSENYVYLKYCKTREIPEGHSTLLLRRWSGLTEHITPLPEGIPPKSDFSKTESFTGTFAQYGRYSEFSDRVDFQLIDPYILHMTMEYGDLAVRTAERLCREEMVNMGSKNFAGANGNISTMVIGETVNIEDYRLLALKLKRILVKPINGMYTVICSPEHIYDLVSDPLVIEYMKYTNSAEPYKTGKPVDLFNIRFEETMLDDFGYNYIGGPDETVYHPGEYTLANAGGTVDYYLRVYANVEVKGVEKYFYMNIKNDIYTPDTTSCRKVAKGYLDQTAEEDNYLRDGSYIPKRVIWNINSAIASITNATVITKQDKSLVTTTDFAEVVEGADVTLLDALKAATWRELPVHKSFMIGDEHMYKTGITGRSGAKMYIKAKGSSGVLDPIDQRQSIGFKIDTLGFNTHRPEAIQVFYSVPTKAAITQEYSITKAPLWTEYFKS